MDIKYLIKNFQLVIAVALLFTACATNDTQKKISTQLSPANNKEEHPISNH